MSWGTHALAAPLSLPGPLSSQTGSSFPILCWVRRARLWSQESRLCGTEQDILESPFIKWVQYCLLSHSWHLWLTQNKSCQAHSGYTQLTLIPMPPPFLLCLFSGGPSASGSPQWISSQAHWPCVLLSLRDNRYKQTPNALLASSRLSA